MSCCGATKAKRQTCPECGQSALSVSRQTLLHQLISPHNRSVDDEDSFFCAESNCSVGYFSAQVCFPKTHLRAFQDSEQERLCYCFDVTRADYQKALQKGRAVELKRFVIEQTKTALCACEARNPSGRCCLVDFKRLEKVLRVS